MEEIPNFFTDKEILKTYDFNNLKYKNIKDNYEFIDNLSDPNYDNDQYITYYRLIGLPSQ